MIKVKSIKLFEKLRNGKFNSFSDSDGFQWTHDFFKSHYSESLTVEASNVFHVALFEEACNTVSMFKLPTDGIDYKKI